MIDDVFINGFDDGFTTSWNVAHQLTMIHTCDDRVVLVLHISQLKKYDRFTSRHKT